MNYYKNLILSNRVWILAVLAVFAAAVVGGVLVSLVFPQLGQGTIASYASSIDKNLQPGFGESFYIFRRNVFIVLLTLFGGAFFGIFPLFVSGINGFILGILIGFRPLYQFLSPWQLFFLLAPHGIFEYTATFLALAFGLKLGVNWLLPSSRGKRWSTLIRNFREATAIAILVVVLLAIAATIEGTLTSKIACTFGGVCYHALQSRSY